MTDTHPAEELATQAEDNELHKLLLSYESRLAENSSCDPFDTVATSMWLEDLSEVYLTLKKWQLAGVTDIKAHLETHPELTARLASSVKVIDVNRATLDLFEVDSREEFLSDIQNHFGEGAIEVFKESIIHFWNKSEKFQAKANFITHKGRPFIATINLYPPKSLADSHRVYVVVNDITTAVQKQQQLKAVMRALPDTTMVFAEDGTTLDILSRDSTHHHNSTDLVVGKKLHEVINSPAGSKLLQVISDSLSSGQTKTIEYPLTINNRLHWFEANIAPIAGKYKDHCAVIWIARDISDRKVMEIELRDSHKNEALGSLSDGIAHEFNNLLAPIVGYSDLLLKTTGFNEFATKAIAQIHKSSLRAADMIKQLLAYGGKSQQKNSIIHLNQFLVEMRSLIEPGLKNTINLTVSPADNDYIIMADYNALKQVILNLCNNAIYAMPDGGDLTLRLEPEQTRGETITKVCLSVEDTGSGIPLEIMDRIFDPFFTTKPVGTSSGLGLSVVKGVVGQYQGEVIVESSESSGTTFKLLFPLHHELPDDSISQQPMNALIVDADETVLHLLEAMLTHGQFQVTTANSGATALEKVTEDDFSLLITDFDLKDMSGLELISKINKLYPDIQTIIASGHIDSIDSINTGDQQPLLVLEKPFELETVKSLLLKAGFNLEY